MKVDTDDLIAQITAAEMRGVSKQAIGRLVQRGKLTRVLIDGYTFVYKKEVENFTPGIGGRPKKTPDKKSTKRRSRK